MTVPNAYTLHPKPTPCPVCAKPLDHLLSLRRRFPYKIHCTSCRTILQAFDDTRTKRVTFGIVTSLVAGVVYICGALSFPAWATLPWFVVTITATLVTARYVVRHWFDFRIRLEPFVEPEQRDAASEEASEESAEKTE